MLIKTEYFESVYFYDYFIPEIYENIFTLQFDDIAVPRKTKTCY
jgi:hypothetical protein